MKVSVELRNGAARFDVAVQAQSIQRAMSFVRGRYPNADVQVKFPIDPEVFFVKDPTARVELIEHGPDELMAA